MSENLYPQEKQRWIVMWQLSFQVKIHLNKYNLIKL